MEADAQDEKIALDRSASIEAYSTSPRQNPQRVLFEIASEINFAHRSRTSACHPQ
jgi:hypothetical protein